MKNKNLWWTKVLCLLGVVMTLTGCGSSKDKLRVAATSVPHAEMLEAIKPQLAKQGIDLEVVVVDDFHIPNRALAEKEVDANFFQHRPYLEVENENFHYNLVSYQKVHIEPMGLYSKKLKDLNDVGDRLLVAIPSDPTNQSRALALLQQLGWIKLDSSSKWLTCSILDITEKRAGLELVEVDAALLARSLDDVDLAAITTNFILQARLPIKPLYIENADSPFANVLVIRQGEENNKDLIALKQALTSPEMEQFILSHYQGSVLPVFESTTKLSTTDVVTSSKE
ncbi:MAG: methionine ABC transporter substrate-binding protein [Parachlamydiales bacterium]|nr:methionine ABC transporter substrate-binding protein [Parachlamydiales bacterium]